MRSEWLYESIEKGYCQDEARYEVKSQPTDKQTQLGMKTSTPERKSMAGDKYFVPFSIYKHIQTLYISIEGLSIAS